MISILVLTAKRPDMLRTALRSIAQQTAVHKIAEVIVSENGEDPRSGAICAEFPGLPITYILREKTVPYVEHAQSLFRRDLKGQYTAKLHDDDWWAADHLEKALEALEAHPTASAYFCSFFRVFAESSPQSCFDNLFFWFGAGYPPVDSLWVLDKDAVLIGSLLGTGGIYSCLVARTEALRKAARIYDEKNPFDNDRMLDFGLSLEGPLIYQPVPHVYYREHLGQDTHNFMTKRRRDLMIWTSKWMIQEWGGDWKRAGELFAVQALKCPAYAVPRLRSHAKQPWCLPLLAKHAAPGSAVAELHRSFATPASKGILEAVIPPVVLSSLETLIRQRPK